MPAVLNARMAKSASASRSACTSGRSIKKRYAILVGWAFSCGDVVIPRPRAPESAGKNWVRIKHINMICYKRLAVNRAAAREVFARTAGCVLQELCASGAANGFRDMWADQNRRQGFCPAGLYARGAMPRGAAGGTGCHGRGADPQMWGTLPSDKAGRHGRGADSGNAGRRRLQAQKKRRAKARRHVCFVVSRGYSPPRLFWCSAMTFSATGWGASS